MSETTDIAVPLSLTSVYGQTGVERLDASWSDRLSEIITYATYRLHFAPLRWLTGLDNLVKAALMFFPGVFLLSQVAATANVKIQLATVGTLMTLGGIAMFIHSLRDFLGGLTINAAGITARQGLTCKTIGWSDLKCWNVDEGAANTSDLSSIQLWSTVPGFPQVIVSGGFLSENDHRLIRRLLQVFAPGKETA